MKLVIFIVFLSHLYHLIYLKTKLKSKNITSNTEKKHIKSSHEEIPIIEDVSISKISFSGPENEIFPRRFFEIPTIKCSRCEQPYGLCFNNSICKCLKGYINTNHQFKDKLCSYKMKSQLISFLLEVFTLVGGDIYLEFYYYSAIKASIFTILILVCIIKLPCWICGMRPLLDRDCVPCIWIKSGSLLVSCLSIIIWEISDLIKIMSSNATDYYNFPLDYFF